MNTELVTKITAGLQHIMPRHGIFPNGVELKHISEELAELLDPTPASLEELAPEPEPSETTGESTDTEPVPETEQSPVTEPEPEPEATPDTVEQVPPAEPAPDQPQQ